MQRPTYDNQETVPLGTLDYANSQSRTTAGNFVAFDANTAVRITPTAGDVWITADGTATADTDGSHPIVSAQDTVIEADAVINTTGALTITPFK